ncbi:MAG: hypothetical protein LUO89_10115 [Methanothrix sp.]|nr:hypothetical protein [Methanothrix sp.]
MTDIIIGRKAHTQEIGDSSLAKFFARNRWRYSYGNWSSEITMTNRG